MKKSKTLSVSTKSTRKTAATAKMYQSEERGFYSRDTDTKQKQQQQLTDLLQQEAATDRNVHRDRQASRRSPTAEHQLIVAKPMADRHLLK